MNIEKEREAQMENLKVHTRTQAETREVVELFFELDSYWDAPLGRDYLGADFVYATNKKLTLGYDYHTFDASKNKEITLEQLRNPVAEKKKKKENELTLQQAKLAWANGEKLQIDSGGGFYDLTGDYCLFAFDHPSNKFRLKPKTITLNGIEIPAIGTDYEQGEVIWILNSLEPKEYSPLLLDVSDELPTYWWSTEEEIKQVVAALRSAFFHA